MRRTSCILYTSLPFICYGTALTHWCSRTRTTHHRSRRHHRVLSSLVDTPERTHHPSWPLPTLRTTTGLGAKSWAHVSFMTGGASAHVQQKKTAPARTTTSPNTRASVVPAPVAVRTAVPIQTSSPAGDGRCVQPVQYRRPLFLPQSALWASEKSTPPQRLADLQ